MTTATAITRRQVNPHAAPHLVEAVAVSRFWRLVDVRGADECWPWLGDLDKGYGVFFYGGRMRPAHELALSFTTGEARLSSLETCHACDNPPCCNPRHLRFDNRAANVADMDERDRRVNGGARLTAAQVRVIRERRAAGARQKDLAAQYGITNGAVSLIVRGLQWRTAGGPIQTERKYHRGE